MEIIQLYLKEGCPFCRKVLHKVTELHLKEGEDFEIIDGARGTPGREAILRIGGQGQVPFLVDGGTAMYESDDIMSYLEKKFGAVA